VAEPTMSNSTQTLAHAEMDDDLDEQPLISPKEDKSVITPPQIDIKDAPQCKNTMGNSKDSEGSTNTTSDLSNDKMYKKEIKEAKAAGKKKAQARIKAIKKAMKNSGLDKTPDTTERASISNSVKDIFKGKDLKEAAKKKIQKKKIAKKAIPVTKTAKQERKEKKEEEKEKAEEDE